MEYFISPTGTITSLITGKKLRPQKSGPKRNYLTVSLRINGKTAQRKVHRLVAEQFIPNPENKPTVNHKDGNTFNNHKNNLEWATYKEQEEHSIKVLGKQHSKGSGHYKSVPIFKYSKDRKTLIAKYDCVMDAGRELGISNGGTNSIIKVAKGKENFNSAYGFFWSYSLLQY